MAERILLHPVKVRGNLLLRDTEKESLDLDWKAAVSRLAPDGSNKSKLTLRGASPGNLVGVRQKNGRTINFRVSVQAGGECNIGWLLKRIPDFVATVREIYWVDKVSWDAQMIETAR